LLPREERGKIEFTYHVAGEEKNEKQRISAECYYFGFIPVRV
jgi:hypothetical protein